MQSASPGGVDATAMPSMQSGSCTPCSLTSARFEVWKPFAVGSGKSYCFPKQRPVFLRRKFSELNTSDWLPIEEAYELWAALPSDDPRGPTISMQIHSFYCDLGVHDNWAFLPWHRAFVYFHERTLGSLIKEPEFRLPAWDWENSPQVPDFFRRFSSRVYGRNHYTLDPVMRDDVQLYFANGNNSLSNWLNSSKFEDFTGAAARPPIASQDPHSFIHLEFSSGMSKMPCAAGEKIFYAHHANMDRLWQYWWDFYVQERQFEPPPSYLSQIWTFYDQERNKVNVRASDFVDPSELGYAYGPPPLELSPLGLALLDPAFTLSPVEVGGFLDFQQLPPIVETLDPAPVDAILDLAAVDLDKEHEIVLTVGTTEEVVGSVVRFGHMADSKNVAVRIGISHKQLRLAQTSPAPAVFLGVRLLRPAGKIGPADKITKVQTVTLQFYSKK